jgi:Domain of unknown function (DUF1816)
MTAFSFNLSKSQKLNRFQINPTKIFNYERSTQGCDSCTVTIQPERNKSKYLDQQRNLGWWIEIFTAHPACIYYFGVFEHAHLAEAALPEFINDLLDEGAKGLVSRIDYHSPIDLTIDLNNRENLLSQRTHFPPGVDLL